MIKKDKIAILGAGISGLIAANILQKDYEVVVFEKQTQLPNNHQAVFRLRTDKVEKATGINLKKVKVFKGVVDEEGKIQIHFTVKDHNSYCNKCYGEIKGEHSIINLDPCYRYISPPDFINRLANNLQIEFDNKMTYNTINALKHRNYKIISTLPLDFMFDEYNLVDKYDKLKYLSIDVIKVRLKNVEVYQTLYYPYGLDKAYRVSITGSELVAEYSNESWSMEDIDFRVSDLLGKDCKKYSSEKPIHYKQKYGKLLPMNNILRKTAILKLTQKYNIFSLGRFATWRQILADDIVDDVFKIKNMLNDPYLSQLHYNK